MRQSNKQKNEQLIKIYEFISLLVLFFFCSSRFRFYLKQTNYKLTN